MGGKVLAWERTWSAGTVTFTASAGDCRLLVSRRGWYWLWQTWRATDRGQILVGQGSNRNLEVARRLAVEAALTAGRAASPALFADDGPDPVGGSFFPLPTPAPQPTAPRRRRVGLLVSAGLVVAGLAVVVWTVSSFLAPPVMADLVGVEVQVAGFGATGTALAVRPPTGGAAAAGWFVTARHVVMVNGQAVAPADLSVRVPGVDRPFSVQSVQVAPNLDLALLEVRGLTSDPLPLASWTDVTRSSWAEVLCMQMTDRTYWTSQAVGLSYTAPAQESSGLEGTTLTTDSLPVPGCSGGPVVIQTEKGQFLAGMLTAVWVTRGDGALPGFAMGNYTPDHILMIPADQIRAFLRSTAAGAK